MSTIDPFKIVGDLIDVGRTVHVGVPCSFLHGLISAAGSAPGITYIAATSEAEAIGIAGGAWLSGRKPLVMMQNSGFCDTINPLASLARPFEIPLLLVVSGRGAFGIDDEPQHELIGLRMMDLFAAAEIPARRIPADPEEFPGLLREIEALLERTRLPAALVVERNRIAAGKADATPPVAPGGQRHTGHSLDAIAPAVAQRELARMAALEEIRHAFAEQAIFVATTGYTGRELYAIGDDARNLYLVGSMGCASAVGLGLARAKRSSFWTATAPH